MSDYLDRILDILNNIRQTQIKNAKQSQIEESQFHISMDDNLIQAFTDSEIAPGVIDSLQKMKNIKQMLNKIFLYNLSVDDNGRYKYMIKSLLDHRRTYITL